MEWHWHASAINSPLVLLAHKFNIFIMGKSPCFEEKVFEEKVQSISLLSNRGQKRGLGQTSYIN
jgi:hypothetical protein